MPNVILSGFRGLGCMSLWVIRIYLPNGHETGNFRHMILYLNTNKENDLLESAILALKGYFSEVIINEIGDKSPNSVQIILNEGKIDLKIAENSEEFNLPMKIGDILQKIQISAQNQRAQATAAPMKIGAHILYPDSNILKMGKQEIALTDKEFDIIVKIFQMSPERMGRDELLHAIWGYGDNIETHTLETHIYRLRQKIEKDPSNPKFLQTDDDGYFLNL